MRLFSCRIGIVGIRGRSLGRGSYLNIRYLRIRSVQYYRWLIAFAATYACHIFCGENYAADNCFWGMLMPVTRPFPNREISFSIASLFRVTRVFYISTTQQGHTSVASLTGIEV
jgi:hypothetical protein